MVGLGESFDEMVDALGQLRAKHVQVITIGQYLRPTERHLPLVRYWHPDEFDALAQAGMEMGFDHVAAGPLVRSSYHADEHVPQPEPGVGPLAAGESADGVFPLKDNIPTTTFPLVTIVLLVANTLAYFLFQHGGILHGPDNANVIDYGW